MRIADREIGPGHPVFLVSEIGVTSCGNRKAAFDLIDATKAAGACAAKFICTMPAKIMRRFDVPFTYETANGPVTRPIYDVLAETVFSLDDWFAIRDYARHRGVIFFATADHVDAVDLLETLDVPCHKSSSWDLSYLPLISKMRATGKLVLVDVGTCTEDEFLDALDAPDDYRVLPVLSPHPIDGANWNMSRLRVWNRRPLGFSAPGRESWPDFLALGLGACLLEKRLTLRRDEATGHHHAVSLEPDEFAAWVRDVRQAEAALREAPFAGTPEAWAERAKWDRDEEGYRR